ncbi:hypothetical protein [Pontibacter rugosus]|uniref:Lipoprotein n=1 Tax=Pontibacter rugosus TaxID=1745966 RepID=A0ABW3SQ79_9BACT
MKMIAKFKTIGFALALGTFMFACDQNTGTETPIGEPEAERGIVQESEMEGRAAYDDFHGWVSTNTARADEVTEEEYREMRTEYQRREREMEEASADWDDETRQAWESTKNDWNEFENKVQGRLGNID